MNKTRNNELFDALRELVAAVRAGDVPIDLLETAERLTKKPEPDAQLCFEALKPTTGKEV